MTDWNDSVAQLNVALADFMNDGLQTAGGTWILTMNPARGERLRLARQRENRARSQVTRIIDDIQRLEGGHQSHRSAQSAN